MTKYPNELLPHENYKLIETDELHNDSFLIRRSMLSEEESLDDNNDIKLKAICNSESNFFNLSCNLLGVFKEFHISIKIINKSLNELWKPEEQIIEIKNTDFEYFDNIFHFYIDIKKIHKKTFPFNRNHEKKSDLVAECIIKHKPTKCNFWHFEITLNEDNIEISPSAAAWKKEMVSSFIRTLFKRSLRLLINDRTIIDKKLYIK